MRKEYISPATEIIKVETEQMIAESPTFDDSKGTGAGAIYSGYASSSAGSKDHTFDLWEEDDF